MSRFDKVEKMTAELAKVRHRIMQLKEMEKDLVEDMHKAFDRFGTDTFEFRNRIAVREEHTRTSIDREALTEALGAKKVAQYERETLVVTIKVRAV